VFGCTRSAVFCSADSLDPAWTRAADGLVRRAMRTVAYGVPIVVVFDCPFTSPAKEEERARRRARAMRAMVDANDLAPSDDDDECGPAPSDPAASVINVHGALQDMVWAAMQAAGVSCMMSPAEADHQLAALHRLGLIWAVLTSDSDLLAMGVPCVVSYAADKPAADKPATRKPAARRGGGAQMTANEWLYADGAAEQARALHLHQSEQVDD
jgi:5'-3' exonuclease